LLLRASSEVSGREADVSAVTDPEQAAESGVANAATLIALADAMVGDDEALARARRRVLDEMGAAQLVDVVAVASNFERMVRIADATGIPLDDPVEIMTSDERERLGINRYTAAANTAPAGLVRRALTPVLRPVLSGVLRFVGNRRGVSERGEVGDAGPAGLGSARDLRPSPDMAKLAS
jgi:hypothetical protein